MYLNTTPIHTLISSLSNFLAVVTDDTPPTFAYCPNDFAAYANEGQDGREVTWTDPVATDDSNSVTFAKTHFPGARLPVGTTEILYVARDPSGNTATCRFVITIIGKLSRIFCLFCEMGSLVNMVKV